MYWEKKCVVEEKLSTWSLSLIPGIELLEASECPG